MGMGRISLTNQIRKGSYKRIQAQTIGSIADIGTNFFAYSLSFRASLLLH